MRQLILFSVTILLLSSATFVRSSQHCSVPTDGVIEHFNISIVPDLSNRITKYHKPVSDLEVLNVVLSRTEDILKIKRLENQRDKVFVAFTNPHIVNKYNIKASNLLIDFGSFENQRARIDFIKNRTSPGLENKKTQMKKELKTAYQHAEKQTFGADIWSFFERVDEKFVRADDTPIKYENKVYHNRYRNILILITDGYIETELIEKSKQSHELGQNRINRFRKEFLASKQNSVEKYFITSGYGIIPVQNDELENLEVLILETYDRSLKSNGNATIHPTDSKIIELFWKDWLKKSGVKRVEIKPFVYKVEELDEIITTFIGLKK